MLVHGHILQIISLNVPRMAKTSLNSLEFEMWYLDVTYGYGYSFSSFQIPTENMSWLELIRKVRKQSPGNL